MLPVGFINLTEKEMEMVKGNRSCTVVGRPKGWNAYVSLRIDDIISYRTNYLGERFAVVRFVYQSVTSHPALIPMGHVTIIWEG